MLKTILFTLAIASFALAVPIRTVSTQCNQSLQIIDIPRFLAMLNIAVVVFIDDSAEQGVMFDHGRKEIVPAVRGYGHLSTWGEEKIA